MSDDAPLVRDPLGNEIRLSESFLASSIQYQKSNGNDLATVLTRPAMIIEIIKHPNRLRYYFRSLTWTLTILITVNEEEAGWVVGALEENPDTHYLAGLLNSGEQIFTI